MSDDIKELTEADFARAIPRRQRERIIRGELAGGDDIIALRRFTGDDGRCAGFGGLERDLGDIQPQAGFALRLVRAVTLEAGVRQDRPDVAIERGSIGSRQRASQH